jgi:hypothetical protein
MAQATKATIKRPRDRSPSFPFIPLRTAIERLVAFEKKFGRHPTPAAKAGLAWGLKEKSSQGDQTLAALKSFGLVKYDGMGLARQIVLTDEGRNYLRAQQESVKAEIRKMCALRPKNIRKFWAIWQADRPADEVAIDKLVLDEGFSDAGARAFLKIYDDTITYAELSDSDKVTVVGQGEDEDSEYPPVQSESEIHPGAADLAGQSSMTAHATVIRRAVFTLDEGDVSIAFPKDLSKESVADLADYLETFMKRLRRESKTDDAAT